MLLLVVVLKVVLVLPVLVLLVLSVDFYLNLPCRDYAKTFIALRLIELSPILG